MITEAKREKQLIKRRWFWTVITVLYVGFIFHNSITPGEDSSQQSGRVLEMVLALARMTGIDGSWLTEHLIRKTAHFAEYTLLGMLLGTTAGQYDMGLAMRRVVLGWTGTLIPLTDETIQLFTLGRSGQISDVWLDMAGVFTGLAVAGLLFWICRRKRKQAGDDEKRRAFAGIRRKPL